VKVKRALISVSDKTGLGDLVKGLHAFGVEIVSTGGTYKAIKALGIPVVEISAYTGFPEMLDGRVKTLHPKIHAGLLSLRDNAEHLEQMKEKGFPFIDMVVVNLYPFEATIAKSGVKLEEAIENIDIGGPSMLRSAAKNYRSVTVVSSPDQYAFVLEEMKKNNGEVSDKLRAAFAAEVFKRTSEYDAAINRYLSGVFGPETADSLPDAIKIDLKKVYDLRYGENPHQKAAFYRDMSSKVKGIADAEVLHGKQLSFNNIMDINAAMDIIRGLEKPAVSVVKHNNPCGAAMADTLEKAYLDALNCDKLSAYGGIVAFNKCVTEKVAAVALEEAGFLECVIAPDYDEKAVEILKTRKNLRILKLPVVKDIPAYEVDMKKVFGGVLIQDIDVKDADRDSMKIVTKTKPAPEMMESLLFAWHIVKYIKSNAILLCQGTRTVGIGVGQTSRVDSVINSIRKAGVQAKGAVLSSDAFFPMADSIEEARAAGISAIIQPGGSIRDGEVIEACDKYGIPMVFTGMRHFRH